MQYSRQKMSELEKALGPSVKTKCKNTHDKIIIVDDEKFMIGSANVFSFPGDHVRSDAHDEIMMTSGDRNKIEELKGKFFSW